LVHPIITLVFISHETLPWVRIEPRGISTSRLPLTSSFV